MSGGRRLLFARRLVTCDPERTSSGPLGVIEDAYLSIVAGRIAGVGARAELPERALEGATVHEAELVTPGLVDAHTHAPWVGLAPRGVRAAHGRRRLRDDRQGGRRHRLDDARRARGDASSS